MTDVGTPGTEPAGRSGTEPAGRSGTEPAGRSGTEPASLVSAVLDEESRRQAEAAALDDDDEVVDLASLPGVDGDEVPLRTVLDRDGRALLLTIGAMWGIGLAIFAMTAILAHEIGHRYHFSFRFLVLVATLPGFTIVLLSQALGNLVDRSTTNRPLVMRWMLALSVVALLLSGAAFNRWEFLGVLAFTGAGVLATVPVQSALLADAFPMRARPGVCAAYVTIGAAGFVVGPLLVALGAGLFAGDAEWRACFFIAAALVAALALVVGRLPDARRGRAEVEEIFHDDGAISDERLSMLHALTRFRQIATLRYVTLGLLAMGFGFIGWGLWFNFWLQGHFQLDAADRALLLALMALPALAATPFIGRLTGHAFRRAPHRAVGLSAVLLLGFNLAVVGWWTHTVATTIVIGALGFVCVVGAIASILPVAQAVIPPQTRAQGLGAFINSLFIGAFILGAPIVEFWPELERQHTTVSLFVPSVTVLGAGLMLYGARFVERDMRRTVEELREERARADAVRAGAETPLLQVHNLDFSYGPVQVLFDIDIEVRGGETLAVLGTNGAGKSTLLRVISGLGVPDRGVVRLDGETITYLPAEAHARKGIVQVRGADVFPGLSVRDNLLAALAAHPEARRGAERRIANVFAVFPALGARRNQDAALLSGGEQQMLALGCALLFEPRLLLIDELSLGLGPLVVQSLLAVVERLKAEGCTMVIVEQSLNIASAISDRVVFIEKGRIRFDGPSSELSARDDLARAVFLGGEGG
jgi:ABC-type branched-subunit amino acid transport system ATPase component/MFS family permease